MIHALTDASRVVPVSLSLDLFDARILKSYIKLQATILCLMIGII